MIKLIAIDLDGTLLTSDKTISDRNKQAIAAAKQAGVHVVLCTGRPIMGIMGFLQQLNLLDANCYCISFNGGLVQETRTRAIIAQKQLPLADAQFLYETLWAHGLPFNVIDDQKVYEPIYPAHNRSLYPDIIKNLTFEQRQLSEFAPEKQFGKGLCCCIQEKLDAAIPSLQHLLSERFNLFKSRPILLELLPQGVDKGYGLQQLCRYLQLSPQQVMAIGDEENDLAMLRFAEYGVAMDNATDDVKELACFVTRNNDQDGVAWAIEQYVLSNKEVG